MTPERASSPFIEAMAKHLPPSASTLQLVDIDGRCGAILADRREDLEIQALLPSALMQLPSSSIDAVTAFDAFLSDSVLGCALDILRPGGRFIAVLSGEAVDESWVRLLERHGFTRILVEAAVDGEGLLIRGEKAHPMADTRQRIDAVAAGDGDLLALKSFRGRYLHLLIRQSPNKPVWQLGADEGVRWRALALEVEDACNLLAFSSLPRAVGFLQEAVLAGVSHDINKVGKFDKATAESWPWRLLLNPQPQALRGRREVWLEIDPSTASAPDE